MTISLFIRRLLVFVILLCLLPTGTWEAMNGGNHPPSEAHDPSEEAHQRLPPWSTSASAPTCPAAGGEPSASAGNMGCHQGDGIDQITYLLAVWGWACLVVCYLGRCAKHAWIIFEAMVRTMLEAKRNARPPQPPAPPVAAVADGHVEERAPANIEEPVVLIAPAAVLADNHGEGAPPPANLAATSAAPPGGSPMPPPQQEQQGAEDNVPGAAAQNVPGAAAQNVPGAAAQNVPGTAAGEVKTGAEVVAPSSSIVTVSAAAAAAVVSGSTAAALLPFCPGRRPQPPVPRRSVSLPERLITPAPAVAAARARANTIGGHVSFATTCIIDGGSGRGQ